MRRVHRASVERSTEQIPRAHVAVIPAAGKKSPKDGGRSAPTVRRRRRTLRQCGDSLEYTGMGTE